MQQSRRVVERTAPAQQIIVRVPSPRATRGFVQLGTRMLKCALGRSGITARKREGDGGSPRGAWPVRGVFYRADRVQRPRVAAEVRVLKPGDGWCDDPTDANYNRPVKHPYPASAEQMFRADRLYDLVVVLGYNDLPRKRGLGSAIFMHVARPGYLPTEGCIALNPRDLRLLLAGMRAGAVIRIGA